MRRSVTVVALTAILLAPTAPALASPVGCTKAAVQAWGPSQRNVAPGERVVVVLVVQGPITTADARLRTADGDAVPTTDPLHQRVGELAPGKRRYITWNLYPTKTLGLRLDPLQYDRSACNGPQVTGSADLGTVTVTEPVDRR